MPSHPLCHTHQSGCPCLWATHPVVSHAPGQEDDDTTQQQMDTINERSLSIKPGVENAIGKGDNGKDVCSFTFAALPVWLWPFSQWKQSNRGVLRWSDRPTRFHVSLFTLQASTHVHGDTEWSSTWSPCPHPSCCPTKPPWPPHTPDMCLMPKTHALWPTDMPQPLWRMLLLLDVPPPPQMFQPSQTKLTAPPLRLLHTQACPCHAFMSLCPLRPNCPHGPHSLGSRPLLHVSGPLHASCPCPAPFFAHPDTYPRVPCHPHHARCMFNYLFTWITSPALWDLYLTVPVMQMSKTLSSIPQPNWFVGIYQICRE